METLELHHGPYRTPLRGDEILIGRARACHVVLSGARVSRRHARIAWDSGAPCLEDLDSRNGVLLNALRVASSVRLVAGDRITIGPHELRVVDMARHRSEPSASRKGAARPASNDDRTTGSGRSLAILEALAEHAVARGDLAEAQAILAPALDQVLAAARDGHSPDDLDRRLAVRAACRLVAAGDHTRWLRYLLELHQATATAPDPEVRALLLRHRDALSKERELRGLLRHVPGDEGARPAPPGAGPGRRPWD
ncbi:MAG: FHA domain-containing protein [Myxococcota bacterium]